MLVAVFAILVAMGLATGAHAQVIEDDTPSTGSTDLEEVGTGAVERYCGGSVTPTTAAARTMRLAGEECADSYWCRTLYVARVMRDWIMPWHVVAKYWQKKRWCWKYPRVFNVTIATFVTDVDKNMQYKGTVSAWSDWYAWCCGRTDSGHVSHRQGKFSNCLLRIGCVGEAYPWVRIRAHGDGSYSYRTGE
jgi:hypothetical protein